MNETQAIIRSFKEMAPDYEHVVDAELNKFWGWSYDDFVDTLLKKIDIQENDLILDLATGTGVIPNRLSTLPQDDFRIIGLDITFSMLKLAKKKSQDVANTSNPPSTGWVGGSAIQLPFQTGSFTKITCGLATHHINLYELLNEMKRILSEGGSITLGDVCVSKFMRNFFVQKFLQLATILYFLPGQGLSRAIAEAQAVSNVRTKEEWRQYAQDLGFKDIRIHQYESKNRWIPGPMIMTAKLKTRKEKHGNCN